MTRIAIFSANYLPNIGGVEKFTQNISYELEKMGIEVDIITNNVFGLPTVENLSAGIRIFRLPCFPLIHGRMPLPRYNKVFKECWDELLNTDYAGVLINARFYVHSILGLVLAKKKGIQAIVLEHGSKYICFGNVVLDQIVKAYEHLITLVIKAFKPKFYAVSKKAGFWLHTFGIESSGIISNAIDTEAFVAVSSHRNFRDELGFSADDFVVSFYGRLVPEKGIDKLIQASNLVNNCNIKFIVAGSGPLEKEVKNSTSEKLKYVGSLNEADVSALLQDSNLMCLPTRSEGFSTALLEASACGVPSLIPDVGGVDELILNESYGNILSDRTFQTLARSIDYLASHPKLLLEQRISIQALVSKQYGWNSSAKAAIRAFEIGSI